MTEGEALKFIKKHGVVLEAARGPVPNLADVVLGTPRRGSWWGHPRGKAFFWLTRRIRAHQDVLVCQLLLGKITYVHQRLWPALARVARQIGAPRLAAINEVHTKTGAHRTTRIAFRARAGAGIFAKGATLSEADALAQLGAKSRDWALGRRG
jgi:hypothetical protein